MKKSLSLQVGGAGEPETHSTYPTIYTVGRVYVGYMVWVMYM